MWHDVLIAAILLIGIPLLIVNAIWAVSLVKVLYGMGRDSAQRWRKT